MALGQGARLVIQAAYFVLIARALGPEAYGAFVTVVAMAALLGPFCGMGTQNLFIKNVRSGKRAAAVCWGNGILLTVLSGVLFSALAVGLSLVLRLRTAASVVMIVCLADLVFLKITELAAFGFTALDRMAQTSIQNAAVSLLRLAAILVAITTFHQVTLGRWSVMYLAASVLGTVYAVWRGSQVWQRPHTDFRAIREDIAEGLYFSIAGSAATVYNDIDKIMLSRLADLTSTGVYAAAYRVIDVSMTPIRALAAAAYPQFFEKGLGGIPATYAYAMFLVRKASAYGLVASASLWFFAPALPHLLGSRYEFAAPAVRWLALIPLLRSLHSFLADALSGAGLQKTRTAIQGVIALVNIGCNLIILPIYSWRGAAWTSLGCDALLALTLWLAVAYYRSRETHSSSLLGTCGF
jgi:O-antigen/teichoic acid export membrane protein